MGVPASAFRLAITAFLILVGLTLLYIPIRTSRQIHDIAFDEPMMFDNMGSSSTKCNPSLPFSEEATFVSKSDLCKSINGDVKRVVMLTKYWHLWYPQNVSYCPCSKCNIEQTYDFPNMSTITSASVLMFHKSFISARLIKWLHTIPWTIRQQQLWILKLTESPGSAYRNRVPESFNGVFNMTISYRNGSTLNRHDHPYSFIKLDHYRPTNTSDYAQSKTRGAFVYISNCHSCGYDRLEVVKELRRYIDVDVFGACGAKPPCRKYDYKCESATHSQYRFYLAFENSLCEDYITEKFWQRMVDPSFYVPVAIGGYTATSYYNRAPPNSFIHLYDFPSVTNLGRYLMKLMQNNNLYNQYHQWRAEYEIIMKHGDDIPTCEICEIANRLPRRPAISDLSSWWNSACRTKLLPVNSC